MGASDTLSEATAPVKLPAWHCPTAGSRRLVQKPNTARVVSQQRLPHNWRYVFSASHLSCTCNTESQYQTGVSFHWGLSVLAQVTSIFTGISISPDALLRQRSNHYAFRAGRNLPDKEFRYLRTVIVTAAVYWGLNSKLRLR